MFEGTERNMVAMIWSLLRNKLQHCLYIQLPYTLRCIVTTLVNMTTKFNHLLTGKSRTTVFTGRACMVQQKKVMCDITQLGASDSKKRYLWDTMELGYHQRKARLVRVGRCKVCDIDQGVRTGSFVTCSFETLNAVPPSAVMCIVFIFGAGRQAPLLRDRAIYIRDCRF